MPGYDDLGFQANPHEDLGFTPEKSPMEKPQGSAASRLGGGFWDTTLGGAKSTVKMIADLAQSGASSGTRPISPETAEALHGLIQAHADQWQKAKDAYAQGRHSEAAGHALATILPAVGPAAAHAADRMGGEAPQFDKYGNIVKPGQEPDIAGGLGEAAGLIVSASPKNVVGPVAGKVGGAVGKMVPERFSPEGIYQSALRPSLAKKNLPKIDSEVRTGLRERIPVSSKGLEKSEQLVDETNAAIASAVQGKSDQLGPVISPNKVAERVDQARPTFAEQVNPEPDLTALNRSKQQFLSKHSTEAPYTKIRPGTDEAAGTFVPEGEGKTIIEKPLTVAEAQAEKQGTYRQLKKKYGELGSADVEAQKALARGLKEEIVKRVPEIASLNARDSALIDLQAQLQKMVAREGNKNLLGLVPAVMSHNPTGFLATLMMDNPVIKSHIAFAMDQARVIARRVPAPSARLAGGAAAIGNASNIGYPPPLDTPPE